MDSNYNIMHFFDKVELQFRVMKRLNPETYFFIIGRNSIGADFTGYGFRYIDLNEMIFIDNDHYKAVLVEIILKLVQLLNPDILYMRYPWSDRALLKLVSTFSGVVFEHQSKEVEELVFNEDKGRRRKEIGYGKQVLNKVRGIAAVTGEILDYQRQRAGKEIPGFVIANGVDIDRISSRTVSPDSDKIHILCMAAFCIWHGYDRLIEGIKSYSGGKKLLVHMVGDGPELNHYRQLVSAYSLESCFMFHGTLTGESLETVFNRCHLAFGALGIHRKGLTESSALKHREYCAKGLPFWYSGKDPDFDDDLPFVHRLPDDDSPVDMNKVIAFVQETGNNTLLKEQMRQYSEKHLSWDVKIKGLMKFLESLSLDRGASPKMTGEKVASLEPDKILNKLSGVPANTGNISTALLLEAFINKKAGRAGNAKQLYNEVIQRADKPKDYLFRVLLQLETLSKVDSKDVIPAYQKVIDLYLKKKRKSLHEKYILVECC